MNDILFYLALGVGILFVFLIVPGLKFIGEVIIKYGLEFIFAIFRGKGAFLVWLVKIIASSHARVLKHATSSRDTIDPTQRVRRKAQGYED